MKYYFWILGCAMNYSDAERMATVLDSLGYTQTKNEHEADLFIVISCSVRQSAVLKIYGKVKDLSEYRIKNKEFRTILTGCVLEKDRKKLEKVFDVILKIKDLDKLPEILLAGAAPTVIPGRKPGISSALDSRLRGNDGVLSGEYLSITPHYESSFRAYVPISTGCNNFCSYCAVPYTRGREKSRPMEEVIAEVKNLVERGYKEITLLGQNVNSYGNDLIYSSSAGEKSELSSSRQGLNNNSFSKLLQSLDTIPGDHRIYFYSNHPKDMSDELIDILAKLKHFPHYIHLPLQSGNDEIIHQMNRHYTKEKYLNLVDRIRKAMPDVNLTTDIIVGYPGETEEQFADTVDVMKKAEYDMAFIAQYSPRPGTPSAKKPDDISSEEKKRREDKLQEIVRGTVLAHNRKLVGTVQRVLIDESKNGKYYGRTEGFKVVEISSPPSPSSQTSQIKYQSVDLGSTDLDSRLRGNDRIVVGQFFDVKIDSAASWKLFSSL